jgi:hypothetical protein
MEFAENYPLRYRCRHYRWGKRQTEQQRQVALDNGSEFVET